MVRQGEENNKEAKMARKVKASKLNSEQVRTALINAGLTVGLLDGRQKVKGSPSPGQRFGRFEVTDIWSE